MTPEQHAQRIRQLELKLELADYGLGMPRDYDVVLRLRGQLEDARKDAQNVTCPLCGSSSVHWTACVDEGCPVHTVWPTVPNELDSDFAE